MTAKYINPALPSMIRGLYRADLRERSIQNMLDLAADLVQELIDTHDKADQEPSDDEREELANLIPLGFREQDGVRNVYDAADRILTAGFRKADREPSDAEVRVMAEHMAHAALDWDDIETDGHSHSLTCTNWRAYEDDARAALIAAQEVRDGS